MGTIGARTGAGDDVRRSCSIPISELLFEVGTLRFISNSLNGNEAYRTAAQGEIRIVFIRWRESRTIGLGPSFLSDSMALQQMSFQIRLTFSMNRFTFTTARCTVPEPIGCCWFRAVTR